MNMKRRIYAVLLCACFGLTAWAQQVEVDPRTGFKDVSTIKEFKALKENTEARLRLCYDTIVYVQGGDIYVRDGAVCGAINFKDTGLHLEQGMILFGTIVGRLSIVDGKAQFIATENTTDKYFTIVGQANYVARYYVWDDDLSDQYIDDVVNIGEVIVDSLPDAAGTQRLYAYKRSSSARMLVTDKYGLNQQSFKVPATCANLKGILNHYGSESELYTLTDISTVAQPTGITRPRLDTDSPLHYNLSGQQVSTAYKGIVVTSDRRKRLVK